MKTQSSDELRLLREIGDIAIRLKVARGAPGGANRDLLTGLEQQSRAKWTELRSLRATPPTLDPEELTSRSRHR